MAHTPHEVHVKIDEQHIKRLMWRTLADAWDAGYKAGRDDEADNVNLADSTPNPFNEDQWINLPPSKKQAVSDPNNNAQKPAP